MRIDSSNVKFSTGISTNKTNEKSRDEKQAGIKVGAISQKAKRYEERLKLISKLEKSRDELKAEKEKIMGNMDLSPDEKKSQIKEVTEQINEIQGHIQEIKDQIQQEKIEEEKKKLEEKQAKEEKAKQERNGDVEKDGVVISKSLYDLMKNHSNLNNIHDLKTIQGMQKLESCYIPHGRDENSYDSKRLQQIAISNARIDGTIKRKIRELAGVDKDKTYENKKISINKEDNKIEDKESSDKEKSTERT